ncbi:hypothetical protein AALF15_01380 [Corynebacteriaceae bacterium 7-707]
MDLIDMGYTIRDVGSRLRWSDIATILRHRRKSRNFWAYKAPTRSRIEEFLDPQTQMMSMVVDEITRLRYQIAGAASKAPPPIMQRIRDDVKQEKRESTKKNLSPSELRKRVAASMN